MRKLSVGVALVVGLFAARAHAAVPAGYTGTPFKGTPWPIPGRIDFENFDEGGQDVSWKVDDHTGNFGEGGCAANGHREGIHPQLCQTNTNPGEVDTFTAGPMMGQKYPSDAMPQSIYIGYTHAVDWVKLTVNVSVAGTYKLSSTWASEPGGAEGIHVQVSMNDMLKADAKMPGTGGYHNWVLYPDFATVELEAGVQVLQFNAKSQHLNYDYLQLSRVLPAGGVDDGSGSSSGGGTGAGGAAGTGGASAGAPSSSGASGTTTTGGATAGTGTAEPIPSAGTGGGVSAAGSAAVAGTASSAGATTATPGLTNPSADDSSSCSVVAAGARRDATLLAVVAGLALGGLLRRRSVTARS